MITDPEPPTMAPIRTDETGAIYVPLYPAPGMRSVPLGVHDLLHLWHVNRQLSQTAAARGDVTEWTAAAVNADVFLGIAAELEPSLARLKALRGPGKPFQAGQSGNPNGTRPGHRHPAFAALDAIGQDGAEAVIRKVVEQALEGDMRAAEILLRRSWPERKGRPLQFKLPPMETLGDLVKAAAAISTAMSDGVITPDEAAIAPAVVEVHRKTLETHEFAARLAAVEARGGS